MPLHMSFSTWIKQVHAIRLGGQVRGRETDTFGPLLLVALMSTALLCTMMATTTLLFFESVVWPSALLAIAAGTALLSGFAIHTGRIRSAAVLAVFLAIILGAVPVSNAFMPVAGIPSWIVVIPLASLAVAALPFLFLSGSAQRKPVRKEEAVPVPCFAGLPGVVTSHDCTLTVLGVEHDGDEELCRTLSRTLGRRAPECLFVTDRLPFLETVDRIRTGEVKCGSLEQVRLPQDDVEGEHLVAASVHIWARTNRNGELEGYTCWWLPKLQQENAAPGQETVDEPRTDPQSADVDFLTVLGHELRTPLTTIIGNTELLQRRLRETGNAGDLRRRLNAILIAGNHLVGVADSMLECGVSAREMPDLEHIDMRDIMHDCDAFFSEQASEKGIILNTRVAKGHHGLQASRNAVTRMVINLVSNAIKFTPAGGVITIDAGDVDDRVRLVVSDTGKGIDPLDLSRVGNPFFRVRGEDRGANQGAGVGLTIVKKLVRNHGGSIGIESEPGQGTTVTIDLPVDGCHGRDDQVRKAEVPSCVDDFARVQEGELNHGHSKTA